MDNRENIFNLDLSDLRMILEDSGESSFRAQQIWQGLYQAYWNNPGEFSTLPFSLRERLQNDYVMNSLQPVNMLETENGETKKTQFRLIDGQSIETVLMMYRNRRTLCISTQSGCPMGCVFCATGHMGFGRNLSSGEIIEQVLYYARYLKGFQEKVTNVVLMGMGEPFLNFEAVMSAIRRLNHPEGYNLGARRFTISTVGIVPIIKRFSDARTQINLAVSLHAADDELRSSLIPVNRKYPLGDLFEACRYYVFKSRRRISFEWALIHDVNDHVDQANRLAKLINGMLCHVNLIPLNLTHRYSGKSTTLVRARLFQRELERNGIRCTLRLRRGIEIEAGCGQLAFQSSSG
jgi:23S rRNA (adenine2503-C2)-methyltransferase